MENTQSQPPSDTVAGNNQPPVATMPPTERKQAKQNNSIIISLVVGTILLLCTSVYFFYQNRTLSAFLNSPKTYEECVKQNGNQQMAIFPGICVTKDGKRFTQPLTDEEKKSLQPPDDTADWSGYTNNRYGFSVSYPADYTITADGNTATPADLPDTLLSLRSQKSFPGSHLTTQNIFLVVRVPNLTTPVACHIRTGDSTPLPSQRIINGDLFFYGQPQTGAAAGTHSNEQEYKVFKNNNCFSVNLTHLESSDWNDPNDLLLADSDRAAGLAQLETMLTTFRFSGTPTPASASACATDSDCPSGKKCTTTGPLIAGQQPNKVCIGNGEVIPL